MWEVGGALRQQGIGKTANEDGFRWDRRPLPPRWVGPLQTETRLKPPPEAANVTECGSTFAGGPTGPKPPRPICVWGRVRAAKCPRGISFKLIGRPLALLRCHGDVSSAEKAAAPQVSIRRVLVVTAPPPPDAIKSLDLLTRPRLRR